MEDSLSSRELKLSRGHRNNIWDWEAFIVPKDSRDEQEELDD